MHEQFLLATIILELSSVLLLLSGFRKKLIQILVSFLPSSSGEHQFVKHFTFNLHCILQFHRCTVVFQRRSQVDLIL